MNKKELAERLNITTKTLYNWESTKPELIKLVKLGLEYEKIKENKNDNEKEIMKQIKEQIENMNQRITNIENK